MHPYDLRPASPRCEFSDLMLQDEQHRTANELASALGALRLALRHGSMERDDLERTVTRLEGFIRIRRLMSCPEANGCDLAGLMRELFAAAIKGRGLPASCRLIVPSGPVRVVAELARAVLAIAHEMLTNAFKHANSRRPVVLSLRVRNERIELKCTNGCDRTEPGSPSAVCLGLRIMTAACHAQGGSFTHDASCGSFRARASLPRLPRPNV